MKLSPHFNSKEFACHCGCGACDIDPDVVGKLEKLRSVCGDKPLVINSGVRCLEYNKTVGGRMPTKTNKGSRHLYGEAVDVALPDGMDIDTFAKYAEDVGFNGIGKYDKFVHMDIRRNKSYWDYRAKKVKK